jgi:rubrerythrin
LEQDFVVPECANTLQNLKNAYEDELQEYNEWYPHCAKIAHDEGLEDITATFINIANAENYHAEVFISLINKIENNSLFKSVTKKKIWRCERCGCHFLGASAPNFCNLCGKPKGFFSQVGNTE